MNATPGMPPHLPPKSGDSTAIIVLAVIGGVVLVIGILSVLAISGVRKYLVAAKSAEARNSITFIARYAAEAYERDGKLCPSASAPVPADRNAIRGKKYASTAQDWKIDEERHAGFACLKFEMSSPQYYQYDYQATATGFTVTARGDLDGDGVLSELSIPGVVKDGVVTISPNILEKDPTE